MSLITPFFESYYNSAAFREQLDQLITYLINNDKSFDAANLAVTEQDRTFLQKELTHLHDNLKVNLYSENPLKMNIPKCFLIDVITSYLTGNNPYGFTVGKGYFGQYLALVLNPKYKPYIDYLLHPQQQDHFIFPDVTLTLFSAPMQAMTPMAYITRHGDRTFVKLDDIKAYGLPSTIASTLTLYSTYMNDDSLPHAVKRVRVNEIMNDLHPITHQTSYPVLSILHKNWTGEDVGLHAYAGVTSLTYLRRDRLCVTRNIFDVHCVVDIEVLSDPIRYKVRLDASKVPYSDEMLDNLESLPTIVIDSTQELTTYIEYTLMPKVLELARPRKTIGELYQIKRQFDGYNESILSELNNHSPIVD